MSIYFETERIIINGNIINLVFDPHSKSRWNICRRKEHVGW